MVLRLSQSFEHQNQQQGSVNRRFLLCSLFNLMLVNQNLCHYEVCKKNFWENKIIGWIIQIPPVNNTSVASTFKKKLSNWMKFNFFCMLHKIFATLQVRVFFNSDAHCRNFFGEGAIFSRRGLKIHPNP